MKCGNSFGEQNSKDCVRSSSPMLLLIGVAFIMLLIVVLGFMFSVRDCGEL